MLIKVSIVIMMILNSGWMIFDGIHVLKYGKYFGPEKPGPWTFLPRLLHINPLKFGPVFIVLGILWIISSILFFLNIPSAKQIALLPPILTLWYIPVGSIISIIYIILIGLT